MAFRRFLILCLLCISQFSIAQKLTPQAKVSLLTVGSGEDIYTLFGHTAIWVYDPMLGIDKVYNYGTFRFDASFYWNFLRGNLPYQLSMSPLDYPDPQYSQLEYYKTENRSVTEQVLNLTPHQKQELFNLLEINYMPQNRVYQYRPFYDNCTTRAMDKVKEACGDSLKYDENDVALSGQSYRDWMNKYTAESPWSALGLNMALGYPIDRITSLKQAAYLPNNLIRIYDHAQIKKPDGKAEKFVLQTSQIFKATPAKTSFIWKAIFWMVMASPLLWTLLRQKRLLAGGKFDRFLLLFTGILGSIMLLLWLATRHGITDLNYSMLVFNPLNLVAYSQLVRRPAWLSVYFIFAIALIIIALVLYIMWWGSTFGLVFLLVTLLNRYRQMAVQKSF
ncbi:MAG: DUF4105 domain-containing protein [Siphonobacter sp.]